MQTIDSAVIVRDIRLDNFGAVREWSTHLSMAGMKSIGVVENHLTCNADVEFFINQDATLVVVKDFS